MAIESTLFLRHKRSLIIFLLLCAGLANAQDLAAPIEKFQVIACFWQKKDTTISTSQIILVTDDFAYSGEGIFKKERDGVYMRKKDWMEFYLDLNDMIIYGTGMMNHRASSPDKCFLIAKKD